MSTKKGAKTKIQADEPKKAPEDPKVEKTKPQKETKAKPEAKPKKLSALDAAAKVLGEKGEAMNCKEMIEAMTAKGYWISPGGQTPHATLYSAILREISVKGNDARFKKTERGKFGIA